MPSPSPIALRFDAASGDSVPAELSAVVQVGADLWLGADEGASLERLAPVGPDSYGAHQSFPLADLLHLPESERKEVDIEGLDFDAGHLWLAGSHAVRRESMDQAEGDTPKRRIRRLARCSRRGNQHLLARIPLDPESRLPRPGATLPGKGRGNQLRRALKDDRHLAPFLEIPAKENGFNIEGLAVRGDRAWLGLRGPVIGGWAVVLGISPVGDNELELVPVERKRRIYEKHFLDLRGLGLRDLAADGDDLLLLAGPTMQLDGDAAVFRWPGALATRGDSVVERSDLPKLLDLPYGRGEQEDLDHPEGLAVLRHEHDHSTFLVVYDAPSPRRRQGTDVVLADAFPVH
jgi:hypothetical protein